MYTKFAVWAGILAGALVGGFIGYLFGRVRGLSAYDRGFSDGEQAAAQKMFELEADNQSLKRQLAIVVSVSESLDGQLTDTVRRQAIGSYDVGQYTKRDGNRVELSRGCFRQPEKRANLKNPSSDGRNPQAGRRNTGERRPRALGRCLQTQMDTETAWS